LGLLYELDPLRDDRWVDLVEQHPRSSLFHSRPWLHALRRAYNYEPVVFTDAPPGHALRNGLLFCRIRSWMTGRRLVSLPFSDHCEPLIQDPAALVLLLDGMKARSKEEGNIEIRPVSGVTVEGFTACTQFILHRIGLNDDLDTIFARFHRSHAQRTIRNASKRGITVDVGRSERQLLQFYDLHTLTRRRHGIPVQPFTWFQHLADFLRDRLTVLVALRQERPVAAMITALEKQSLVYKYGASDSSHHRFGGMSLLFWEAIQLGKRNGASEFDLGRSDLDDVGLIAFKEHFGAVGRPLTYYSTNPKTPVVARGWRPAAAQVFGLLPESIQGTIGASLYRHFG
jgi:hypothetical protein